MSALKTLNILDIVRGTTVDGPGFRTSIYIAGCRHACPGCHNPQSWDFSAGSPMSIEEIMDVIKEEDFNVTLTGGDPLYHPLEVKELCKAIHDSGYTVWIYTGFTIEQINANPVLKVALQYAEAVVEGPYIEALRDADLRFRGSSNQRIIYQDFHR